MIVTRGRNNRRPKTYNKQKAPDLCLRAVRTAVTHGGKKRQAILIFTWKNNRGGDGHHRFLFSFIPDRQSEVL